MFSFNFQIEDAHIFEVPDALSSAQSFSSSSFSSSPATSTTSNKAPAYNQTTIDVSSALSASLVLEPNVLSPLHTHRLLLLFLSADIKSLGFLSGEEIDEIAIMNNLGPLSAACREILQSVPQGSEVKIGPVRWLQLFQSIEAKQIDDILNEAESMRDTFPPLSVPSFVAAKTQKKLFSSPGPQFLHTLLLALVHANLEITRFVYVNYHCDLNASSSSLATLDFLQRVDEGREKLVSPFRLLQMETEENEEEEGDDDEDEEEEEKTAEKKMERQEMEFDALGKRLQSLGDIKEFLLANGAKFTHPLSPFPPSHSASLKPSLSFSPSREQLCVWLDTFLKKKKPASAVVATTSSSHRAVSFSPSLSLQLYNAYQDVLRGKTNIEDLLMSLSKLPSNESRAFILNSLALCANRSLSPEGGENVSVRPYCQICHRVVGVAYCQGCGVVAYCSQEHCDLDCETGTHSVIRCKELLLSRALVSFASSSSSAAAAVETKTSSVSSTIKEQASSSSSTTFLSTEISTTAAITKLRLSFPSGWSQVTRKGDSLDQFLLTDQLSFVMTVAWSLQQLGFFSSSASSGSAVAPPPPSSSSSQKGKAKNKKNNKKVVAVHTSASKESSGQNNNQNSTKQNDNEINQTLSSTTGSTRKTLVVYVLGAAEKEAQTEWERLLEWCHNSINRVTVVLIGPQVVPESSLTANGRLRLVSIPGLLHHVLDQLTQGKPDIIFALNSGIHWYDSWVPTLRLLTGFECPIVISAWQVIEALAVREVLLEKRFSELIPLQTNNFCSLVPQPVRDQHAFNNHNNWFVMGFSPSSNPTPIPSSNAQSTAVSTDEESSR